MTEKMSVVLAGGSGFVGRHLAKVLNRNGYAVICVSRNPNAVTSPHYANVISWEEVLGNGLPPCEAVINLSGANIMQLTRRWTMDYMREVASSRIETTRRLAAAIQAAKEKPNVFVTASGVGFYQPNNSFHYDEYNEGGTHDFLAQLAKEWEAASHLPKSTGVRVCNIRTGAVLGRDGGVIKNLYWPFFFGLGGPVGNGRQPFPWIHIEDIAHLYLYMIENNRCEGAYNGVSPQMITNADFTRAFAKAMRRPAIIPTPSFVFNVLLGEDRAKILTQGQIVHPKRALDAGYKFIYPEIDEACQDICAPAADDDKS